MPAKRAGGGGVEEAKQVLAAVLLADSFTQRFRPITVERPKVLLPLVNAPLLEYTLEWLALNKVEEIYVFCCAHADHIKRYLADSKWSKQRSPVITPVVSTNCLSAGEALRLMDHRDLIKSDFVLVSGDTVSNMALAPALAAHRARREKDKNAIMTMVMKSARDPHQRLRLGDSGLLVVLDPASQRLLRYQEMDDPGLSSMSGSIKIDTALFGERDGVQVRWDLLDTHIAICAPEVLLLFSDNFDYQNLKRDFVSGVLSEEELGNKLYIHELQSEYAARVHTLRSYDAISRDLLQRWAFPFVPDTNVFSRGGEWGGSSYRYVRGHRYMETGVSVARSARTGVCIAIGAGSSVGDGSVINHSVIGRNCRIGRNCVLKGAYLQDGVVLGDGCTVTSALLCEQVVLRPGAQVQPGAVLSYGVVVGPNHSVPAYARVSLCKQMVQTQGSLSDDETEYTGAGRRSSHPGGSSSDEDEEDTDGEAAELAATRSLETPSGPVLVAANALAAGRQPAGVGSLGFDKALVGEGGAGYGWPSSDGMALIRFHSIAMPPTTLQLPGYHSDEDEDAAAGSGGGGGAGGRGSSDGSDAGGGGGEEPEVMFRHEVVETFLRCVKLRFDQTNAVIELNGLKIAEDRTFSDCARYIFTAMLSMCLPPPPWVASEYRDLFATGSAPDTSSASGKLALLKAFKLQLNEWGSLLQRFLRSEDDQVELLLTLEEYCSEEGVFEGSGEAGRLFGAIFPQLLQLLYEQDVVSEEAFTTWAEEKGAADESDKLYLTKAAAFLEWLRTADEEEEEDSDDDE